MSHRDAIVGNRLEVDEIVAAIRDADLSSRDLVRISYALAQRGANTTLVLGQYGEELVADAYGGSRGSFDQKGYDVVTAAGEQLQVQTTQPASGQVSYGRSPTT